MTGLAVDADQIASFVDVVFRYGSPGRAIALRSSCSRPARSTASRTPSPTCGGTDLFAVYRRKSVDSPCPPGDPGLTDARREEPVPGSEAAGAALGLERANARKMALGRPGARAYPAQPVRRPLPTRGNREIRGGALPSRRTRAVMITYRPITPISGDPAVPIAPSDGGAS